MTAATATIIGFSCLGAAALGFLLARILRCGFDAALAFSVLAVSGGLLFASAGLAVIAGGANPLAWGFKPTKAQAARIVVATITQGQEVCHIQFYDGSQRICTAAERREALRR